MDWVRDPDPDDVELVRDIERVRSVGTKKINNTGNYYNSHVQ